MDYIFVAKDNGKVRAAGKGVEENKLFKFFAYGNFNIGRHFNIEQSF